MKTRDGNYINFNYRLNNPQIIYKFYAFKYREFLTGFRKRKLQRKQKAKEELQQQLKEERKRIKQEESIYICII